MLITTAPEVPGIATHDFLWRKLNATIHRLENVGSDLRKISGCFPGCFRFVNWLVFLAASKTEQCACSQAASDSGETEKIARGWQQYPHRAIIDTPLVNRVARKFLTHVPLENIEQALTDRQETHGGTGKKNRANERLVSQWRERARLEIADFGDQLVEHLPFGFDLSTQQAKPPQIVEGSFAQLFGGASK
jgi:hypothetical protein